MKEEAVFFFVFFLLFGYIILGFTGGSAGKESAMQETWVGSLCWKDPLEEGMATYSRILAWRIPMNRGAWWATVHEVAKSWT